MSSAMSLSTLDSSQHIFNLLLSEGAIALSLTLVGSALLTLFTRRKQKLAAAPRKSVAGLKSEKGFKGFEYSGLTDASTDDASDYSRARRGRGGIVDLDLDSSDAATRTLRKTPATPPGLEPPRQQGHPWARNKSSMGTSLQQPALQQYVKNRASPAQHWNPPAAAFVPGSASAITSQDSSGLTALREALDNLAPGDVETLKTMLDSKMQEAPSFSGFAQGGATHSQWQHPYTPFQGKPRPGMPQRPSKPTVEIDPDGDTLRTFLSDLSSVDNARVLSLRKINRLGMDSSNLLQTHLATFGSVDRIMVSHTLQKLQTQIGGQKTRVRPATLGFAVMSTVEGAKAILAHGAVHTVAGVEVTIGPFASHTIG